MVGVAVVLLVTNLAAYVMPGAPSAWFGLIAPSVVGIVVVRRGGALRPLPEGYRTALLAMGLVAVGVFALAYANQPHIYPNDEGWHYALAQRMARGEFPPVTPYGVDAGIGYHYGGDLLTATIISTTGALPWIAFDALAAFLVAGLVLAIAGLAYNLGTPLALALGVGAAVGSIGSGVFLGHRTGYLENLASFDPSSPTVAFGWARVLHQLLAVGFVVLVAAALHAGARGRHAALLLVGAGVLALGDASVMIFASTALALVGGARLIRLRGRERLVLAGALVTSALLVALAGGPVSDAIFHRGGTAGMVRVAWEPFWSHSLAFQQVEPALIRVGVIPLAVVGALAAYWRRSWGLAFLAAAGALGLLEAQLLQSQFPWHLGRIGVLANAVATIGALAGVGTLIGALRGRGRRLLAALAFGLLVLVPTGLPRAVDGVQLALSELKVANAAADDTGHHYRDRMRYGQELEANWELYAWLARSLPKEARLLTPNAVVSASAAGIASPTSHRAYQMFIENYETWVYEDALRFLHRDDLADLGITHLHLTDDLAANLDPAAMRLLDDPRHFRLLVEIATSSGVRHWIYEVMPGAGATEDAMSSYRALRESVSPQAPLATLGSLTQQQRWMILSGFADHQQLLSPIRLRFERATRVPQVEVPVVPPDNGVVVLPEPLEPTALGVSRNEAIWSGHGLRAYDLAAAWSPVWRVGTDPAALPGPARSVCDTAGGEIDLQLLGEPGTRMTAGATDTVLTGLPQVVQLAVPDCKALTLSADAAILPFVQIRPRHAGTAVDLETPVAGLGFDGSVDGERAVLNFWYRNPEDIAFTTGTEFRLYEASPLGVDLQPDNPNPRTASLRWWPGPVALRAPEQIARIEFDARRLEINGDAGGGAASSLTPGKTYLLTLNVAGTDPRYGLVEIQQVVPLARVVVGEGSVAYEVLSGVVTIEHHAPGSILQRTGYDGGLAEDATLAPR